MYGDNINLLRGIMKIPRYAMKYAGKAFGFRPLRFGKNGSQGLRMVFDKKNNEVHIDKIISSNMRVKPDITIPVNPETLSQSGPRTAISWKGVRKNEVLQGEIGNMAIRLAKKYKRVESAAHRELKEVFGCPVKIRAKGSNSVYSKLIKMMRRTKTDIHSDEEGAKFIQDAIGGRIYLRDMTQKDLVRALRTVKINGQNLTEAQKTLVRRVFENDKTLMPLEREMGEQLAKPVKLLLAERQMEPRFQNFMISAMKDAIDRGVATIESFEQAGIDKNIIRRFKTAKKIRPLRMTEVNNYKGLDGIPYFSDRQINQFERLQLATGEKFDIISCSEVDLNKYGYKNLPKKSKDAIKKGGYTTGQINVLLEDGTPAEVQIRGMHMDNVESKDHTKYDAEQGKKTLGKMFFGYIDAIQDLNANDKTTYNKYMSGNFDYTRNIELGSITDRPTLPSVFNRILTIEEMEKLQADHNQQMRILMQNFKPAVEYAKKKFRASA